MWCFVALFTFVLCHACLMFCPCPSPIFKIDWSDDKDCAPKFILNFFHVFYKVYFNFILPSNSDSISKIRSWWMTYNLSSPSLRLRIHSPAPVMKKMTILIIMLAWQWIFSFWHPDRCKGSLSITNTHGHIKLYFVELQLSQLTTWNVIVSYINSLFSTTQQVNTKSTYFLQ